MFNERVRVQSWFLGNLHIETGCMSECEFGFPVRIAGRSN